ncbi:MAG: metallophosphoesterase [Bacteroidales bacterium]|nr:metallophosphoesterase [Bacteroidales bacterium]
MKKITHTLIFACLLLLQGCESFDFAGFFGVTGPAVDERFAASVKLLEKEPVPDITVSSDEYRMILVTDIHSDGKDDKPDRFVSACLAEEGVEKTVICLGDMVNGRDCHSGVFSKLQPVSQAPWRFLNALGNHDTYFKEFDTFKEYWPLTTYTFNVNLPSGRKDFFICLDSADGACGVLQRQWVENILKEASGKYRNIYVLTHTNFFNTDNTQLTSGNFSLEETYDLMSLFSTYGVKCVLTGHDHHFEKCVFRGVTYYTFNALCLDPGSYYKLTFGEEFQQQECSL